ncbi:MAG: ABC transporter ATP-binding protein [Oscillospiraceae bacterium]|jgi:ATP-binding cassette subfamily B multidrug efflux pump|nr:ABC transporter ATP-binding protein [Oscillospiraceae bacterium]
MARNKYDVDETLESPFSIKHFARAAVYAKKHVKSMLLALLFSVISVISSLLYPLILQRAFNVTIPEKKLSELIILTLVTIATILLSIAMITLRSRIMAQVGQSIIYDMRKDLFEHLQKLPFQFYDDRPQGKILTRVIHYVNNVSDMLSNGIINFFLEIFNIIFIAIFMFAVHVKLSLIVVAGVPLFLLVIFIIKPAQRRSWQQVSNKGSNMNAYMQESIDGAKITQLFTREEENAGIFDRLNNAHRRSWIKAQAVSNTVWVTVDNISVWVLGAMYIVGILVLQPAVPFGTIVAISNYASRFWQPLLNLSNLYNTFINSIAYLERIFEMMDEPVVVKDCEGATELPAIEGGVTFDDVTFAYVPGINILEHLSFDVKPGESIALVGPTGAGKTTVVNLISRFYNLTGGQVLIDGHDISKVTLHSLRSQMGIMLQDSFIFSGSILDNIRYAKLNATEEEIKRACHTVCADEFIEEMEEGYETQVNERGSRLSQGQKQLIAFARTLLSDPKILILDEATSSIDAKTERQLQTALNELLKGRTSFIIAHRLSTIKNCDKIMYISNRGISECGTHEELLAKRGDYYKLYMSQKSD